MVLCTLSFDELSEVCQRLEHRNIAYFTQSTPRKDRCNLFFGKAECLEAIRLFLQNKPLHLLSAEEDFILGSLLGYDLCLQCKRYCKRFYQHGQTNEPFAEGLKETIAQ